MTRKGGRVSAESTAIAKLAQTSGVEIITYLEPPYELGESEAHVWESVVRDCAPDWFTAKNIGLLKQYCRHAVSADHIAELIAFYREDMSRKMRGEPTLGDVKGMHYRDLLQMQISEGRAMANLAVKMRIAHQSTIDAVSSHKRVKGKDTKPLWEI
jgi:hypothetical protein